MATKRSGRGVRLVAAGSFIDCRVVALPRELALAARDSAVAHNPANAVNVEGTVTVGGNRVPARALAELLDPFRIAVLTNKYWGKAGVKLGVSFLDNPNQATRNKILAYANKWSERCNVVFQESSQGQVRIARADDGYWSYLGTDIEHIAAGQATMNLQGFTENSPSDAEYDRVVPHEFGHTCGCPHEHSRRAIIDLLDPQKTIKYFQQTYGWNALTTRQQVLTPVEESSLLGYPGATGPTDQDSVMCYSFAGACTKSGKAIVGGSGITAGDYAWMAKLYPKADVVEPGGGAVVAVDCAGKVITAPPGWVLNVKA